MQVSTSKQDEYYKICIDFMDKAIKILYLTGILCCVS